MAIQAAVLVAQVADLAEVSEVRVDLEVISEVRLGVTEDLQEALVVQEVVLEVQEAVLADLVAVLADREAVLVVEGLAVLGAALAMVVVLVATAPANLNVYNSLHTL